MPKISPMLERGGGACECANVADHFSLHKATMKKERNKMIAIKVLNGATLSSIGKEYGITPERVRRIVFRVCLRASRKNGLRDKLPEKWFYLRNARQYKDLLINAIEDYWG
jgi:hypothetical protein